MISCTTRLLSVRSPPACFILRAHLTLLAFNDVATHNVEWGEIGISHLASSRENGDEAMMSICDEVSTSKPVPDSSSLLFLRKSAI